MQELSLWESHSCSAIWFHVRLCEGQRMLKGVCKAGGGEGLAPASWFAVPDYHLAAGLNPSIQPVPVVIDSSSQLYSAHPQSASWWPFRDVSSASQHPAPGSAHRDFLWASDAPMPVGKCPSLEVWIPALPTLFQTFRFWKLTILPFVPPALMMLTTSLRYSLTFVSPFASMSFQYLVTNSYHYIFCLIPTISTGYLATGQTGAQGHHNVWLRTQILELSWHVFKPGFAIH